MTAAEEIAERQRRQQVRAAHEKRLPQLKERARRTRKIDDRIAYVEELFLEEGDGSLPDPALL
jgi:hypothetical protein